MYSLRLKGVILPKKSYCFLKKNVFLFFISFIHYHLILFFIANLVKIVFSNCRLKSSRLILFQFFISSIAQGESWNHWSQCIISNFCDQNVIQERIIEKNLFPYLPSSMLTTSAMNQKRSRNDCLTSLMVV